MISLRHQALNLVLHKGLSLHFVPLLRLLDRKMLRAFLFSLRYATIHAPFALQKLVHGGRVFSYIPKQKPVRRPDFVLVRERGLEPPRPKAHAPKACVSTNSTTRAYIHRTRRVYEYLRFTQPPLAHIYTARNQVYGKFGTPYCIK